MAFVKNTHARESIRSTESASSMDPPKIYFGPDADENDSDRSSFADMDAEDEEVISRFEGFRFRSLSIPFRNKNRARASTRSTGSASSMNPPEMNFGRHPDKTDRMDSVSISSLEQPPSMSGESLEGYTRSNSPVSSYCSMNTESSARAPSSASADSVFGRPFAELGDGDVACSSCSVRASKSCLTCVHSFCHDHLKDHYVLETVQSHQLVEVSVYQEIKKLKEENLKLREEISSLRQQRSIPARLLPTAICNWKTPSPADVVLDEVSAHPSLVLFDNGKSVKFRQRSSGSSSSHHGFNRWECVMAKEGFSSGRHYWEVRVNSQFTIGVMSQFAPRVGRFTFAPSQDYWCLFHKQLSFTALNEPEEHLPKNSVPRLLGVCVDVDEKWVTFYNAETLDLIYTFNNLKQVKGEKIYPVFRTLEKSAALRIKSLGST